MDNVLDRIFLRDYIRRVEIGAFHGERGIKQRIRFNVVLEVNNKIENTSIDDVDKIISYDDIVTAIEMQLTFERLNLLETLAERICAQILLNQHVIGAKVRIEKLNKIKGATLGIEIVRNNSEAHRDEIKETQSANIFIICMSNKILYSNELKPWLDTIAGCAPVIVCLQPHPSFSYAGGSDAVRGRIFLLSIEQNAWILADKDSRYGVVRSRTELDWAINHYRLSIWAPTKMILDALNKLDLMHLAGWLKQHFSTAHICLIGSDSKMANVRVFKSPNDFNKFYL